MQLTPEPLNKELTIEQCEILEEQRIEEGRILFENQEEGKSDEERYTNSLVEDMFGTF